MRSQLSIRSNVQAKNLVLVWWLKYTTTQEYSGQLSSYIISLDFYIGTRPPQMMNEKELRIDFYSNLQHFQVMPTHHKVATLHICTCDGRVIGQKPPNNSRDSALYA